MSERAIPHVRAFLGQRVRELRKRRGLSQESLGSQSALSGKFIGEVERGEKSISIDSLYKVSVALRVPLSLLTDVGTSKRSVPTPEAEKILALVLDGRRPRDMRRSYDVLRRVLGAK
jgi:XRE family transcriptional regulator, regulator of sulfur utilization